MPQPPIDPRYVGHNAPMRRQAMYIGAAAAVVIILFWLFYCKSDAHIYNPGPLSSAHAIWEHDCLVCHKPRAGAGFVQSVTDSACLNCHRRDGQIHHRNQLSRDTADDPARPDVPRRAAHCASCHMEHGNRPALMAVSDEHCVQCHRNLTAHTSKPAELVMQRVVTEFAAGGKHPQFGRQFRAANPSDDGKLDGNVDPTQLKFNHRLHLEGKRVKGPDDGPLRCDRCHSTADPGALPASTEQEGAAGGSSNQRNRPYMRPITYARNCAACHRLDLGANGLVVEHTSLSRVRTQLADVKALIARSVAAAPAEPSADDDLLKAREGGSPAPTSAAAPSSAPAPAAPAAPPAESTETDPLLAQREKDVAAVTPPAAEKDRLSPLDQALQAFDQTIKTAVGSGLDNRKYPIKGLRSTDPAVLEYYVLYGMNNSCFKCHVIAGDLAVDPPPQPPASTQPARTVATGITPGPRRWYTNSFFNHDVHRIRECLYCHSSIIKNGPTDDQLGTKYNDAPDEWARMELAATKRLNLPGLENCVSCHHGDNASTRGAGVKCITCHYYHDRSLRDVTNLPATQPMVMLPHNP